MKKILVLRGGPSSEYEISMKTGRAIIEALKNLDYTVSDCVVDKNKNWFIQGIKYEPHQLIREHDLFFNAMHGEYGEDGEIQQLLENLGVKFTGPKTLGARMAMNKELSKKIFKENNLKTPLHRIIKIDDFGGDINQIALNLFRTFPMPVVIKPIDRGSSVGVTFVHDYQSLLNSLISLFVQYDRLLVEEYIKGKEATVGVIEEFRNQKTYSFLPIEIKCSKNIFDYDAKYADQTEKICPGNFSHQEKMTLQELAVLAHQSLGLRHYSRTDFIIHPQRGIYILETNSLPGLAKDSLFPKAIEAVGSNYNEFLKHIINLS
jgi:D-alanine-D-alanine ligase